jgi:hypothetical protein
VKVVAAEGHSTVRGSVAVVDPMRQASHSGEGCGE